MLYYARNDALFMHSPGKKLIADFWVVIGLKIGNQFCQGECCQQLH